MVDTAADVVSDGDGVTSLREAILQANELKRPALITFDPAVFGLFQDGSGAVDFRLQAQLFESLTIAEGAEIVIDGRLPGGYDVGLVSGGQIFEVETGARLTLRDLTLGGGREEGQNGAFGFDQIDQPGAGGETGTNNGGRGPDGKDSDIAGSAGETAVAGIRNLGELVVERVTFEGLDADGGDGGRGGRGGGGGDGGNAGLTITAPTGRLLPAKQPNGFAYDNYNPEVVVSEPLGDGGDGGSGGDGSAGGGGGDAAGAVLNAGSLVLRDARFVNVSAEGGRGGQGGTGGGGGDGGDAGVAVDPSWVVDVQPNTGTLLSSIPPTFEAYAGIPRALGVGTPTLPQFGLVLNAGVYFEGPDLEDWNLWYGLINRDPNDPDDAVDIGRFTSDISGLGPLPFHGRGGDAGNGGRGGDGGEAAAVLNRGSLTVEGAQGEATGGRIEGGAGAFGGDALRAGLAGEYDRGQRDIEFEWDRPFTSFLGIGLRNGPAIGQAGIDGADGADGDDGLIVGASVTEFASAFFVEPLDPVVFEGDVPGFLVTRSGDPSVPASVRFETGLSDGLENADFASPPVADGEVAFAPGTTSVTVLLPQLADDGVPEGLERLTVSLEESTAYGVGFSRTAQIAVADAGSVAALVSGTEASETLFGEGGLLEGLGGDDRLYGSEEDETIEGGEGDDVLGGGGGDDTLTGGPGADLFSFLDAFGSDVVTDFEAAVDLIETAVGVGELDIVQDGGDVLIVFPAPGPAALRAEAAPPPPQVRLLDAEAAAVEAAIVTRTGLPPLPDPGDPGGDELTAADDQFVTAGDPVAGNLFADNGGGPDTAGPGGTLRLLSVEADGTPVPLGTPTVLGSGASLTVEADGSFLYDPAGAFGGGIGTETIDYVVTDAPDTGSPDGFDPVVDVSGLAADDGSLGFVAEGGAERAGAGYAVSTAGDVDGDGLSDLLVSAIGNTNAGLGPVEDGAAYLIYGSDTGFPLEDGVFDLADLDFGDGSIGTRFDVDVPDGVEVTQVAAGGDLNDDGIDDLAIAAEVGSGARVYVVYGAAGGLGGRTDLAGLESGDGSAGFAFDPEGERVTGLAMGGDVNGDGTGDLVIGAPETGNTGAAYVLFGSSAPAAGLLSGEALRTGDGSAGYALRGFASGDLMGSAVAIPGDLDGDGIDDLAIGASGANISSSAQGRIFVLFGNDERFGDPDGNVVVENVVGSDGVRGFSVDDTDFFGTIGNEVAPAGDIDGDGLADLLIGDFGLDRAFLLFGSDTGFPLTAGRVTADELAAGAGGAVALQGSGDAGIAVSGGGDVDGDGTPDILLYSGFAGPGSSARAFVVSGTAAAAAAGGTVDLDALPAGDGASGFAIDGIGRTADLDGRPVASAGDLDGDGVAEIVIGASREDTAAPVAGKATVLFGRGGDGPSLPTASATATFEVGGFAPAPTLPPVRFALDEDTALSVDLGDAGSYALAAPPASGSATVGADGALSYSPAPDFAGDDALLVALDDGTGPRLLSVGLTVRPVNDPPEPADDTATTSENAPVEIAPLADDTDRDGDTLTVEAVSPPARGTVSVTGGIVTFDPAGDFDFLRSGESATEEVEVSVGDGTAVAVSTLEVTVTGVDTPPVTVSDEAQTLSGVAVEIDALANDLAGDAGPISLVSARLESSEDLAEELEPFGIVEVAGGRLVYTPSGAFQGADRIVYEVSDGVSTVEGIVDVRVEEDPAAPDASDDTAEAREDGGPVTIDVLANDTGSAPLEILAIEGPFAGTTEVQGESIVFDPAGAFEALGESEEEIVQISYSVSDGQRTDVAFVEVTVLGENDPPRAEDDAAGTGPDQPVDIAVLANDTDVEDDPLAVGTIDQPATGGTVTDNGDGTLRFVPDPGFAGTAAFAYTASDGLAESLPATVTVEVEAPGNRAPEAVEDAYALDEDATLTVAAAAGVLANDSDPDGDPLSATVIADPANGTLTLGADGAFTYVPDADFSGADAFTYRVSDIEGASDTANVSLNVRPVNDPPVAVDDSASVPAGGSASGNVLANDTDVDGDRLTAVLVSGPSNGTATVAADGAYSYAPDAGFSGTDSFTYRVEDGEGGTDTGRVTVTVAEATSNAAPAARDDAYALDEDTGLTVSAGAGVLANDTDPDGDTLIASVISRPVNGALDLGPDGSFTYVPEAEFSGSDSFNYRLSDGAGGFDEGRVTLTVSAVNDPPVLPEPARTIAAEGQAVVDLLAGVTDPEGDPPTVTGLADVTGGTAELAEDGTVVFTPAAGASGEAGFSYTVSDGRGGTATGTVALDFGEAEPDPLPRNSPPDARPDTARTREGEAVAIPVLGNDADPDGDPLVLLSVTAPATGSARIDGGLVRYTSAEGFAGTDSFSYTVGDGRGGTDTALVEVTVDPANRPPEAGTIEIAGDPEDGAAGDLLAQGGPVSDPDGDPLTVVSVAGAAVPGEPAALPSGARVTVEADGGFDYDPGEAFAGATPGTPLADSFDFSVSDGRGGTATGTVAIDLGTAPEVALDALDLVYLVTLGRLGDAPGKGFLNGLVEDLGFSLAEVAGLFPEAPEFESRYGPDIGNAGLVDVLYGTGYGREPDEGGDAFWTGRLEANAASPGEVIVAFAFSDEHLGLLEDQGFAFAL